MRFVYMRKNALTFQDNIANKLKLYLLFDLLDVQIST